MQRGSTAGQVPRVRRVLDAPDGGARGRAPPHPHPPPPTPPPHPRPSHFGRITPLTGRDGGATPPASGVRTERYSRHHLFQPPRLLRLPRIPTQRSTQAFRAPRVQASPDAPSPSPPSTPRYSSPHAAPAPPHAPSSQAPPPPPTPRTFRKYLWRASACSCKKEKWVGRGRGGEEGSGEGKGLEGERRGRAGGRRGHKWAPPPRWGGTPCLCRLVRVHRKNEVPAEKRSLSSVAHQVCSINVNVYSN